MWKAEGWRAGGHLSLQGQRRLIVMRPTFPTHSHNPPGFTPPPPQLLLPFLLCSTILFSAHHLFTTPTVLCWHLSLVVFFYARTAVPYETLLQSITLCCLRSTHAATSVVVGVCVISNGSRVPCLSFFFCTKAVFLQKHDNAMELQQNSTRPAQLLHTGRVLMGQLQYCSQNLVLPKRAFSSIVHDEQREPCNRFSCLFYLPHNLQALLTEGIFCAACIYLVCMCMHCM